MGSNFKTHPTKGGLWWTRTNKCIHLTDLSSNKSVKAFKLETHTRSNNNKFRISWREDLKQEETTNKLTYLVTYRITAEIKINKWTHSSRWQINHWMVNSLNKKHMEQLEHIILTKDLSVELPTRTSFNSTSLKATALLLRIKTFTHLASLTSEQVVTME